MAYKTLPMQNAIIKYKIRLKKPSYHGKEIEITMKVSEFETDWSIKDQIFHEHQIDIDGWDAHCYLVIERTIEPFNED